MIVGEGTTAPHEPGRGGEEGDNWFVSMTDMMVGVLFVFIIALMVFAYNFRVQTDEQVNRIEVAADIARQVATLRNAVDAEATKINEAEQTRARLLGALRERLATRGLSVEVDESRGVLRLAENAIRFDRDRSALAGEAADNVDIVAAELATVLPEFVACGTAGCSDAGNHVETIFIEGHTDATGSDERNWQLSTERAVNTYRRLIAAAPALRTLRNGQGREVMSVSGYASTRPVVETDGALDANRRIDLRIVMEADQRKRLAHVMSLLGDMETRLGQMLTTPAR